MFPGLDTAVEKVEVDRGWFLGDDELHPRARKTRGILQSSVSCARFDASRGINICGYLREKLQTINCFETVEYANPAAVAGESRGDNVGIHHARGNYDLHLNTSLSAAIFVRRV